MVCLQYVAVVIVVFLLIYFVDTTRIMEKSIFIVLNSDRIISFCHPTNAMHIAYRICFRKKISLVISL